MDMVGVGNKRYDEKRGRQEHIEYYCIASSDV
jgi:hypothetical protein